MALKWEASPFLRALLIATPSRCNRRFSEPSPRSKSSPRSASASFFSSTSDRQKLSPRSASQEAKAVATKEIPFGVDATIVKEYSSEAELLQEFTNIPSIDKAWIFKSDNETCSRAMFSIGQIDLLANKKRTLMLSSHIFKETKDSVSFVWSPFPVEMPSASAIVPSPSGSKILVVRNKENESSTQLEIWGPSQLERVIHIPKSVHGSLYTDRWFEGISWNHEETHIAYIAEEPFPSKPQFDSLAYKRAAHSDNDRATWRGQGDWKEDWGETYTGKMKPSLFVIDVNSGDVQPVEGIAKSLSVGQVVWAPSPIDGCHNYLVFVGWSSELGLQKVTRKLGMKVCYNRPCALYAIRAPFQKSSDELHLSTNGKGDSISAVNLTYGMSSAFFPRFSPDGKFLVFLSANTAVDSGAHAVTKSLHRMDWFVNGRPCPMRNIVDVVPVVMNSEDGCFPGLYCAGLLYNPWLSDGHTMVLSSAWCSTQVILSINILSFRVSRVSPTDSSYSWNILAIDEDNIIALSSSPIDPPQIKYGYHNDFKEQPNSWYWLDVSSPLLGYPEKIRSLLSSHKFTILKIPVKNLTGNLTEGAKKPFEAIFIPFHNKKLEESCNVKWKDIPSGPLILLIHGGPHSVTLSSYSKSAAFLSSLGYSLLIVNYRGSVGFGEEALHSLPGNIGCQDVDDVMTALDYVIEKGLINASNVALYGSSHGGFLATHLVGQAPDRFAVAAVRNPVCNLSLMVDTTDIPDWCYALGFGTDGQKLFSGALSTDHLSFFYNKSPISHLSKVKAPVLFLLGAKDRRVPFCNGLQYARGLRERGVDVKVIVFPEDGHVNFRPRSEFESLLNIAVWFNNFCK